MNVLDSMLANYPHIAEWFRPWLLQLFDMCVDEEYQVILNELERVRSGTPQEEREPNLERLDHHLDIASVVCKNFPSVFSEKSGLGRNVKEVNATIFDKLAEIRSIVGLHRLGFKDIQFIEHPDFCAKLDGQSFLVEVTRFGYSMGKRADVWDSDTTESESGIRTKQMYGGERSKSVEVISEAIYHKIVDECKQFRNSKYQSDGWIVWISTGRDYLTVPDYVMEYTEPLPVMPNAKIALDSAMKSIRETGTYTRLSYTVLSHGRDDDDLISPELNINV